MRTKIQYSTTLERETIQTIRRIAAEKRWDHNDVIEVAVEEYKNKHFPVQTPNAETKPVIVSNQ